MKIIWCSALIGLMLCLVAGCDQGQVKVTSAEKDPAAAPASPETPPPPPPPPAPSDPASPTPTPQTKATPTNEISQMSTAKTNSSPSSDTAKAANDIVAVIKTPAGDMVIEFWPEVAPKTVENFKKLAASGFYDGTSFHRIVKGFMVQGGDPLSKDPDKEAMWGTGGPGYTVEAEFNDRSHQRGVVSMARSADPNSAGSQFFLCLGDASFLDKQYTAFGVLIKGDDVLAKLGDTPVGPSSSGEMSKPTQRVELTKIELVERSTIQ